MSAPALVDLAPRLDDPELAALLSHSVGFPTPEKLQVIANCYRTEATWRLLGIEEDGAVVGCIGIMLETEDRDCAVIRHIAVAPQCRGRGIGRLMIEAVCADFRLRQLMAETDAEAVEFYRRCGFEVASLGERYPGVERFRCVKHLKNTQMSDFCEKSDI
jgi:ribosomal protein S18 acetylase RimI-like enzyme